MAVSTTQARGKTPSLVVLDPVTSSLRPSMKAFQSYECCAQTLVQDQDPTNQLLSYLPLDFNADGIAVRTMNVELQIHG
jgi:hypothetical protein